MLSYFTYNTFHYFRSEKYLIQRQKSLKIVMSPMIPLPACKLRALSATDNDYDCARTT